MESTCGGPMRQLGTRGQVKVKVTLVFTIIIVYKELLVITSSFEITSKTKLNYENWCKVFLSWPSQNVPKATWGFDPSALPNTKNNLKQSKIKITVSNVRYLLSFLFWHGPLWTHRVKPSYCSYNIPSHTAVKIMLLIPLT